MASFTQQGSQDAGDRAFPARAMYMNAQGHAPLPSRKEKFFQDQGEQDEQNAGEEQHGSLPENRGVQEMSNPILPGLIVTKSGEVFAETLIFHMYSFHLSMPHKGTVSDKAMLTPITSSGNEGHPFFHTPRCG
jgi:hypothetical protein